MACVSSKFIKTLNTKKSTKISLCHHLVLQTCILFLGMALAKVIWRTWFFIFVDFELAKKFSNLQVVRIKHISLEFQQIIQQKCLSYLKRTLKGYLSFNIYLGLIYNFDITTYNRSFFYPLYLTSCRMGTFVMRYVLLIKITLSYLIVIKDWW